MQIWSCFEWLCAIWAGLCACFYFVNWFNLNFILLIKQIVHDHLVCLIWFKLVLMLTRKLVYIYLYLWRYKRWNIFKLLRWGDFWEKRIDCYFWLDLDSSNLNLTVLNLRINRGKIKTVNFNHWLDLRYCLITLGILLKNQLLWCRVTYTIILLHFNYKKSSS